MRGELTWFWPGECHGIEMSPFPFQIYGVSFGKTFYIRAWNDEAISLLPYDILRIPDVRRPGPIRQ